MHLRTLSTLLSDVLSHLPSAEYERAKREALAAQVKEQRSHIEDLARRLEYTTRQKDEAEEAHVDAYEIRLDKIEGERDAIKAQYEAEKVAHGNAQRHLTAAIAERDAWQRSHGTVAREKEQLKTECDALRARVVELQAGEPVAWVINYADGDKCPTRDREYVDVTLRRLPDATVTPLYAAPQPAAPAYGVEGERFVCWEGACMWLTDDDDDEGARDTGTRAEAEARAKKIAGSKVMRLVDADAPVVDIDAIRKALSVLDGYRGNAQLEKVAARVRAAIGEEA